MRVGAVVEQRLRNAARDLIEPLAVALLRIGPPLEGGDDRPFLETAPVIVRGIGEMAWRGAGEDGRAARAAEAGAGKGVRA